MYKVQNLDNLFENDDDDENYNKDYHDYNMYLLLLMNNHQ
jgi:hypothetical protein